MSESLKEQTGGWYVEYGKYINKNRAFCSIYDGLKLVERRIFQSLVTEAKNSFTKSARVVGHCIGHYHPHGDSSAYGTLVQLVNNGMVDKQGNFGTKVGLKDDGSAGAAAARYTEVKMNNEVFEEAFELLKYVKEEDSEMCPEVPYLPTRLPFCLRMKNYSQGIGFGSRAYIPAYSKSDLIKRLDWLLHDKTGDGPVIKPITDCTYESKKEDFLQLLTTGKASLLFKGKLELDKDNKCVYIRSLPVSKKMRSVINAFKDEITIQKSIGYLDESTTNTKVKFMLTKRGQNLDKLYKKLQQKTSGSVAFECNMCDREGNVILVSVDQMLLNTYQMYKDVNENKLKIIIAKLEQDIIELTNMQKIKKVLPELLKKYPDDLDNLVAGIIEKTQLEEKIIRDILDKYNIPKFLKAKIDIDGKKQELNTEKNNLQNLDSYVWNRYQ